MAPSWKFKSLTRGSSSGFPLTNHLGLPGSGSIFGLTQGPPLCVCTSLSKMDSSTEAYGEVDTTYFGVAPSPFFDP